MRIKLMNTGSSRCMELHYQRLVKAGWGSVVTKETKMAEGTVVPGWNYEETSYYIEAEIGPSFVFDLSEVLDKDLICYKSDGQPVIEIYDDWRE